MVELLTSDQGRLLESLGRILERERSGPEALTREIRCSVRSVNEEDGEYEFVGATETPVNMGLDAPEVLRMDGAEFDASLPLLDAHNRKSSTNVIGRAYPRKEGRSLIFRARFSKATQTARDACALVKDRSIDSVSIGYLVQEYRELRDGEVDGEGENAIRGPAYVVTKWRCKELSLVPIGADPNARRRAFEAAKENPMFLKPNPGETREQFFARAMADAEVVKQIPDEAKRKAEVERAWSDAQPKPAPAAAPAPAPAPAAAPPPPAPAPGPAPAARSIDEETAIAVEGVKRLVRSVCPVELREFADGLFLENPLLTFDQARKALLDERARRMVPGGTPEPKIPSGAKPTEKPQAAAATAPALVPQERNEVLGLIKLR